MLKYTFRFLLIVLFSSRSYALTSDQKLKLKHALNWSIVSTETEISEGPEYQLGLYCYTGKTIFTESRGLNNFISLFESMKIENLEVLENLNKVVEQALSFQDESKKLAPCIASSDIYSPSIIGVVIDYIDENNFTPIFPELEQMHEALLVLNQSIDNL